MLGLQAPSAFAQAAPGAAERLHANAVASFRQARFPEAYGRFIRLADAGHAPSAEVALWMYLNGPTLFGKDWAQQPGAVDGLGATHRPAGADHGRAHLSADLDAGCGPQTLKS